MSELAVGIHRREAIRQELTDKGTVIVSELAARWGMSEMTIRRDLDVLAAEGVAARVHGGAVAAQSLQFGHRLERHRREKGIAARKLVEHLPEQGAVYLDGSTTIHQLVALVGRRPGLLAATNSIETFRALQAVGGLKALLIGGELNPQTDNLVGPQARRFLDGLLFDAAFFSAYALDPEVGPSEPSPEDAEIKHLAGRRSRRVHLAMNHHKFATRATAAWSHPADAVLATDLDPADPRLDPYRSRFTTIV